MHSKCALSIRVALIDDFPNKKVNLRALHCVFESQNDQRCRELFTKADGKSVFL